MKYTTIAIVVAGALVGGAILFSSKSNPPVSQVVDNTELKNTATEETQPTVEPPPVEAPAPKTVESPKVKSTTPPPKSDRPTTQLSSNVSMVNGKQIIEIAVKGGYAPKTTLAKMGVPTILHLKTDGSYDCSVSMRIPTMGISKFLPASGTTEIDLGTPKVASLDGVCAMGMYSFRIDFQG